jgi:aminocarboxymuconate-semialdehyde decarboxylase
MSVVDSHFHWFPRTHLEQMAKRTEQPRTERQGDGFLYRFNEGRSDTFVGPEWMDLDWGLETSAAATGPDTVVVCTTGVLTGLLDQMPAAEAFQVAYDYNEEMAAAQRAYPGRFFGTAMIPLHDTDEAVRLLDQAISTSDLRGVNLGPMTADGPIDTPRLEPFYARVAELGVPLIVHPTDIQFGPILTGYDSAMQNTIGRVLDSSVTVLRLIYSGIMERHPELQVLHTHAGGLLPYQAGRLDKNGPKSLPNRPSYYLKRTYVDTVAPQALTVSTALAFYGPDHVLYGTDQPCWKSAAAVAVIDEVELEPEDYERVMWGNSHRLLRTASVPEPVSLV